VSKDFDRTLSDALDLTAQAAQTAGPTAARIRGRKRTLHQRIALSTVSLVIAAVGATAAFTAASSNGGGTSHPTVQTSTPVIASPTPTIGPSASSPAGPTASPSTGASNGQSTGQSTNSSPTMSTPPTSGSPASNQSTNADPQKAVAAAWLTPGQMPFASSFTWTAQQSTSQGGPIGQQLTPTIFYVPKDTSFQAITVCGDPSALLARTTGAQHTNYSTTASGTAGSQFIFFFADATSAQQTFAWLQGQYSSSCVQSGSSEQVTKTGGDGVTSAAWLTTKGATGPVDMSPYNREYFVLRGSTIAYVSINSTATLPTTYDDAAQLSAIASHLCVYGGPCS
jgi:hypothetical protein